METTDGMDLQKYGDEERLYLVKELAWFWAQVDEHDFENADNFRICRVGDADEEYAYDEIARTGCCGSHSTAFGPSPGGHHYRYGFNYGH